VTDGAITARLDRANGQRTANCHTAGFLFGFSVNSKQPNTSYNSRAIWMTTMSAVNQNGCIVVILTGGALALGLWLDTQFHTKPIFALCLMLGSIPLSTLIVWRVTMRLIKRLTTLIDANPHPKKDDS